MKKCRSISNSLRARSISKTYQAAFFHLGECATYQPAIDQSDWPIQTVIVHGPLKLSKLLSKLLHGLPCSQLDILLQLEKWLISTEFCWMPCTPSVV